MRGLSPHARRATAACWGQIERCVIRDGLHCTRASSGVVCMASNGALRRSAGLSTGHLRVAARSNLTASARGTTGRHGLIQHVARVRTGATAVDTLWRHPSVSGYSNDVVADAVYASFSTSPSGRMYAASTSGDGASDDDAPPLTIKERIQKGIQDFKDMMEHYKLGAKLL